jgi:hypothetical protein
MDELKTKPDKKSVKEFVDRTKTAGVTARSWWAS